QIREGPGCISIGQEVGYRNTQIDVRGSRYAALGMSWRVGPFVQTAHQFITDKFHQGRTLGQRLAKSPSLEGGPYTPDPILDLVVTSILRNRHDHRCYIVLTPAPNSQISGSVQRPTMSVVLAPALAKAGR